MKVKKLNSLRKKGIDDLKEEAGKKRLEFAKEYSQLKAGKQNNPKKARELKKDIAQILTIMREKEIIKGTSKKDSEKSKSRQKKTK
ncbi:MAG: 50S ribosomal protein L29 [Candidatus Woesebacteria bacterium]|jgi:ribosomal protein L29